MELGKVFALISDYTLITSTDILWLSSCMVLTPLYCAVPVALICLHTLPPPHPAIARVINVKSFISPSWDLNPVPSTHMSQTDTTNVPPT